MDADGPRRPGLGTWAGLLVAYALAAAAATWPHAAHFADELPGGGDPPQHLWILRWYRACLAEGRSPLVCPELQYPVGAPLGNFSPLHAQAALYLPLSLAVRNEVLCYNILWIVGLATTGLGTAVLAWHAVRDRLCAAVGGLLAMLGGSLMYHAQGHLELIYLGGVPLFLVGWMRLVDRPGPGRLATAVGLYLLMTACAAYYAVLAIAPAVLYVAWGAAGAGRRGAWGWLRARAGWLVAFGALVLPGLLVLFAGQVWALAHGQPMVRSRLEFEDFHAPLWGYVAPTPLHRLGRFVPSWVYASGGYLGRRWDYLHEEASYLGLVTLALMAVAAAGRARFRRAGYWWATLGLLVVLSLGAYATIGPKRQSLPALWLWKNVPMFRLIRSPARFNLPATVAAAVIASAGLHRLLAGRRPAVRRSVAAVLALAAVADLGFAPYGPWRLAPLPACYEFARRSAPGAALLEVPVQSSAGDRTHLDRTYWQSLHRAPTSAGYSGVLNVSFNQQIFLSTPFPTDRPDFLADPARGRFGLVDGVAPRDYAWLFLAAHDFRFVVLPRNLGPDVADPGALARLRAELGGTLVFEDASAAVFDRDRLAPPARPVLLPTTGWRPRLLVPGPPATGAQRDAGLAAYDPSPGRPLVLTLQAAAVGRARTVRLTDGPAELARLRIEPGPIASYATAPFRLGPGLRRLTLASDGEARPSQFRDVLDEARTPYSLRVDTLRLEPTAEAIATGPQAEPR